MSHDNPVKESEPSWSDGESQRENEYRLIIGQYSNETKIETLEKLQDERDFLSKSIIAASLREKDLREVLELVKAALKTHPGYFTKTLNNLDAILAASKDSDSEIVERFRGTIESDVWKKAANRLRLKKYGSSLKFKPELKPIDAGLDSFEQMTNQFEKIAAEFEAEAAAKTKEKGQ